MNITLKQFLSSISADDYFIVNIRKDKTKLFLGYSNEVPNDILNLIVNKVYIDFPSQALGIDLL